MMEQHHLSKLFFVAREKNNEDPWSKKDNTLWWLLESFLGRPGLVLSTSRPLCHQASQVLDFFRPFTPVD